MLLKKDLLEGIDEKYHKMLSSVSVVDFTRCVAQYSGLSIQFVSDEEIKRYLHTWAINKYRFYKVLKGTKVDTPIEYQVVRDGIKEEVGELMNSYPAYAPWLDGFQRVKENKIVGSYDVDWPIKSLIQTLFPTTSLAGMSLTHFFARYLKAPDGLVTALGRVFENDTFIGTHTISIDPVDMMLASENPYNWCSCYRLDVPNECSHADGCMAAVLDDSSLIAYTWNKEGEFGLYGNYKLKSIRYKRTRQWLSVSPNMTAIHFNTIYPTEGTHKDEFKKTLRKNVEDLFAKYLNKEDAVWLREHKCDCHRSFYYGYGEFSEDKIWKIKGEEDESWNPYNEIIYCACGCKTRAYESDCSDLRYTGEGFNCSSWREEYWCEYCDDYCSVECCAENCSADCDAWRSNHPVCDLDDETECDNVDWDNVDNGFVASCKGNCAGCPLWKEHHPEKDEEDKYEETVLNGELDSITGEFFLNENMEQSVLTINFN